MGAFVDDDLWPGTAIVRIVASWDGRVASASGVIVGLNDVLTSAHALLWRGRLPDKVAVWPSFDPREPGAAPFAPVRVEAVTGFDPEDDGFVFDGDGLAGSRLGAERDIALLGFAEALGARFGVVGIDAGVEAGTGAIYGYSAPDGGRLRREDGAFARLGPDDSFDVAGFALDPGMSGGPLVASDAAGAPRVVGLVSTAAAAVRVGGHLGWLRAAMDDNDRFLFGAPAPRRGPPAEAQDAPAWYGPLRADRAGGSAADRMSGGAGDDVLFGRGGADHVDGRDGADLLSGGLGPDTLKGGDGNDTLIGCYGDDRFIGGRGFDTAVYLGRSADHLVTPDGDGHRVTFASGRYERLTGIERLLFSDGAFILDA